MFSKLRKQQRRALVSANFSRCDRKNDIASGKESIIEENVAPSRIGHKALKFVTLRKQQVHVNLQVGEVYKILTNIQGSKFNNEHVQQSFRDVIRETISSHLPLGLDIEIERLDSSHNSVFYRIISKATQKENTTTTSSAGSKSDENDAVQVDRLDLPQTTNIGAHPSLRPHLQVYGKALIVWLRHKGYLNDDIESALQIDDDEVDVTSWGIYLKILNAYEEIEVEKTGFTKKYHGRRTGGKYTSTDDLRVYCDFSKLDYETDIGIQYIMRQFFQDVRNDIEVPAPIKRMLCEKFHDLGGGRFGGMDVFTGKTIEAGDQYIRGQCVVGEHCQFDDSCFHCMRGKVLEADYATASVVSSFGILSCDCLGSWPVAPHPNPERNDQMYMKPTAFNFCGIPFDLSKDAYDGPAIPGATTIDERYNTSAYTPRQHLAAQKKIRTTIAAGGFTLLDSNKLNEEECDWSISNELVDDGYSSKVKLYSNEISLYVNITKRSVKAVCPPLCRGGDIRKFFSLNKLGQGCINIQTSRNLVSRAKGLPIDLSMPAIEAHMAQRNIICGLGQSDFMRGLFLRHYLAPSEGAFDRYGGNSHGRITHKPLYPMAQKNKAEYSKRI